MRARKVSHPIEGLDDFGRRIALTAGIRVLVPEIPETFLLPAHFQHSFFIPTSLLRAVRAVVAA